jgi:hypothetical protein
VSETSAHLRTSSRLLVFGGVFVAALGFLLLLGPTAPFTKELGACESSAVRDVLSGHAILPYFEPGSIVQVPPFSWWCAAFAVHFIGWREVGLRLPEILAAAFTCTLMFAWLAEIAGFGSAAWAAVCILLCHFFIDAARQPRMDAMFAMFITAIVIALERALAASGRRRAALSILCAALMSFGTLTKGPLALVFPGLIIAVFFLLRGRLHELLRPGVIATFFAATAGSFVWYFAAYRVGGEQFLEWQVYGVLFHRFMSSEIFGHSYCRHPFYYFAPHIFAGFLPWSLYFPALAIWLWKRRGAMAPHISFLLCWFLVIFGFFSAASGKCLVYILPAFPPLAGLLGCFIAETNAAEIDSSVSRWFSAGSAAIGIGAIFVTLAAIGIVWSGFPTRTLGLHRSDQAFLDLFIAAARSLRPGFLLWQTLWPAAAILIVYGVFRRRTSLQLAGVTLLSAAGVLFWFGTITAMRADQESLKSFASEIDRIVPQGARVSEFGWPDCDLTFYLSRPLGRVADVQFPNSSSDGSSAFLVITEEQLRTLSSQQRSCLRPIAKSDVTDSHGHRVLMSLIPANSPISRGTPP